MNIFKNLIGIIVVSIALLFPVGIDFDNGGFDLSKSTILAGLSAQDTYDWCIHDRNYRRARTLCTAATTALNMWESAISGAFSSLQGTFGGSGESFSFNGQSYSSSLSGGGVTSTGSTSSTGGEQPFGGQIIFALPCICSASSMFIQTPVTGDAGPYNVSWLSLKSYGSVLTGNHVLGSSNQGGVCSLYVIFWCFDFETQQDVTFTPGMGTSLAP